MGAGILNPPIIPHHPRSSVGRTPDDGQKALLPTEEEDNYSFHEPPHYMKATISGLSLQKDWKEAAKHP